MCEKSVDKECVLPYNNARTQVDGRLAQLGEHLPYKQGVIGSSPIATTIICESGSVVEHRLAKARVASSNLVFRSIFLGGIAKW